MFHCEDIAPVLEIRTFAYDLLRRTFSKEPSSDYLKTISQADFIANFPFTAESTLIQKGVQQISDYLQHHDVMNEEIFDQLHWDYTRLFIGPYRLPAPPWESAYQTEERLLFQEQTLHVRQLYAQYGFSAKNYYGEPDDHLGLELDYMYQLAHLAQEIPTTPEQLLKLLNDSKFFLESHLLNWVPALSQDITQNASTDFYKGMASILNGYLTLDLDALNELINTEAFHKYNDGGETLGFNPESKKLHNEP